MVESMTFSLDGPERVGIEEIIKKSPLNRGSNEYTVSIIVAGSNVNDNVNAILAKVLKLDPPQVTAAEQGSSDETHVKKLEEENIRHDKDEELSTSLPNFIVFPITGGEIQQPECGYDSGPALIVYYDRNREGDIPISAAISFKGKVDIKEDGSGYVVHDIKGFLDAANIDVKGRPLLESLADNSRMVALHIAAPSHEDSPSYANSRSRLSRLVFDIVKNRFSGIFTGEYDIRPPRIDLDAKDTVFLYDRTPKLTMSDVQPSMTYVPPSRKSSGVFAAIACLFTGLAGGAGVCYLATEEGRQAAAKELSVAIAYNSRLGQEFDEINDSYKKAERQLRELQRNLSTTKYDYDQAVKRSTDIETKLKTAKDDLKRETDKYKIVRTSLENENKREREAFDRKNEYADQLWERMKGLEKELAQSKTALQEAKVEYAKKEGDYEGIKKELDDAKITANKYRDTIKILEDDVRTLTERLPADTVSNGTAAEPKLEETAKEAQLPAPQTEEAAEPNLEETTKEAPSPAPQTEEAKTDFQRDLIYEKLQGTYTASKGYTITPNGDNSIFEVAKVQAIKGLEFEFIGKYDAQGRFTGLSVMHDGNVYDNLDAMVNVKADILNALRARSEVMRNYFIVNAPR